MSKSANISITWIVGVELKLDPIGILEAHRKAQLVPGWIGRCVCLAQSFGGVRLHEPADIIGAQLKLYTVLAAQCDDFGGGSLCRWLLASIRHRLLCGIGCGAWRFGGGARTFKLCGISKTRRRVYLPLRFPPRPHRIRPPRVRTGWPSAKPTRARRGPAKGWGRAGVGRPGVDPGTLGLRGPCSPN